MGVSDVADQLGCRLCASLGSVNLFTDRGAQLGVLLAQLRLQQLHQELSLRGSRKRGQEGQLVPTQLHDVNYSLFRVRHPIDEP